MGVSFWNRSNKLYGNLINLDFDPDLRYELSHGTISLISEGFRAWSRTELLETLSYTLTNVLAFV
jgi:hypothetical protein